MKIKRDVIIVGSGAAGLFCALNLPGHCRVLLITKDRLERSDSYLAQGGICVAQGPEDYESFYEDTMRAGHYKNDPDAVKLMVRSSNSVIADLLGLGVEFARNEERLRCTREGGHSKPRIVYHQDITGKEVMTRLMERVRERDNIEIHEFETMVDLVTGEGVCRGIAAKDQSGTIRIYEAGSTVLACGGVGGLFQYSTNYRHITGDAISLALKYGIVTENVDWVQLHPTTFYDPASSRCLLISESVRGEGAVLLNAKGERFTNELAPRDVVARAILAQMEKDGAPHVYLSMAGLGEEMIRTHFPNICQACLEKGIDVLTQNIPVVPAQHYLMGGIKVDLRSRTSMEGLYAIGETSCNGVHGANRLASNSLLESLVFAKAAARDICDHAAQNTGEKAAASLGACDQSESEDLREADADFIDSFAPLNCQHEFKTERGAAGLDQYHRLLQEKMGDHVYAS